MHTFDTRKERAMALGGIQVGSVRGIPIRLHFTFLLVLPLLAFAFSRSLREAARVADIPPAQLIGDPWLWGLGMAVALFASVLVHELAHSLYALRVGGKVKDITLMMIGGVSQLTESPKESRHEAMMAFVGPLASLVIGGTLIGVNAALEPSLFNVRFALFYLGALNLVLGVFNLLPAFPMDGGRILRALMTPRLGLVRATRTAAMIGKGFAILFGLFGLVSFNLLLVLVAFFIFMGAEGESRQVQIKAALEGLTVGEIMRRDPQTLTSSASVETALESLVDSRRLSLVVDRGGGRLGVARLSKLERVPLAERARTSLDTVTTEANIIAPEALAVEALTRLGETRGDRLVVAREGAVVGTLSEEDLLRALRFRQVLGAEREKRGLGWRDRQQPV